MSLAPAQRARVETVFAALRAEGAKWGVDLAALTPESARYDSQRDPSSGEEALLARWTVDGRRGQMTLRADGHVFAECDLLVDHPRRPVFWIEAATVWGILPLLKSEPRLVEKPAA